MSIQKAIGRKGKHHVCGLCKGTGELSKKEHGYFGYMLECLEWALKAREQIEAAEAEEQAQDAIKLDVAKLVFQALEGTGEDLPPNKELSKEDRDFLRDLGVRHD
jgi:hypothetical protein